MLTDPDQPTELSTDLVAAIREMSDALKQVPALALTAFARSEDRRRALLAGFQMHISKPVEPAELCTGRGQPRQKVRFLIAFSDRPHFSAA
jgi:hypothetical protein